MKQLFWGTLEQLLWGLSLRQKLQRSNTRDGER